VSTSSYERVTGGEAASASDTRRRFRRGFVFLFAGAAVVTACGWDPSRPFDRDAPQVTEALRYYDAGEAGSAADLLQDYLTTGACSDGNIGTPLRVRERPNGSFDLGLSLFKIAESFGQRFGDEENDAGSSDPNRTKQVDCALRIVRAIAEDLAQPVNLRARARYLEGNLLFMTADYKAAVTAYDHALELVPGMGDAGPIGTNTDGGKVAYASDGTGRDAAWNRAIALRRIEDKKDAGNDAAPPDGGGDGGNDQNDPDSGKNDDNKDAGNDDKDKDSGKNDPKEPDAGKDSGSDEQNKPPPKKDEKEKEEEKPPPPSRQSQDDRILDQLENAPTVQQEAAKKHGKARKVRGLADK
jgi:hypothetical protein